MDLYTSMRVYTRVVEAGSLTGGAERSDISIAMVSKHIRFLENRLGTSLLVRTTRRQTVTDFGEFYYRKCLEILDNIESLESAASMTATAPKGMLRVSLPRSFGVGVFMSKLDEFMAEHPGIKLDIRVMDAVSNIVEDGVDAAIRLGELPDSELIAKPLASYHLLACAAPSYIARRGLPKTPADLLNHECLTYAYPWNSEWRSHERSWRFKVNDVSESVEVESRLRVNDALALRKCVVKGVGVAVLPKVLVEDDLREKRLIRLLKDYEIPSRPMHLVYPSSRYVSAKLRVFIDFLTANFGQDQKA